MRFPLTFILLSCLPGSMPGASPSPSPLQEKVVFSNLTASHGMRPGGVTVIFQDRKGNHWMGTAAGLSRFDGVELTHYDATDGIVSQVPKNIVALAQDLDDTLWIGSDGQGLSRFEPAWGVRERFDSSSGLSHNCVTSLQMDPEGSLWIGTRAGLDWMDRKTQHIQSIRITPGTGLEEILSIQLAPNGTVWVSVARHGIYRKTEGGDWVLVWRSAAESMKTVLGPDGDLWAYLAGEGLLQIPRVGSEVHFHEIPRAVLVQAADQSVLALEADKFGDLWLGTSEGLLKYTIRERRWTQFEHQSGVAGGLVAGRITCLLEDRRSLLWAGSDQGELSWHALTRYWFPGFSEEASGLCSNEVNGFATGRDGGVWIATGKGLNRLDLSSGEITRQALEGGPAAGSPKEILCVLEDQAGCLWVGTRREGLAMRPAGAQEFHVFRPSSLQDGALPEGAVAALFEDHQGHLWAAVMGNGIVRYFPENGGRFQRFLPPGREPEMLFVNDFESDGNQGAWLATVGGGLWHLDAEQGLLQPLRERIALQQPLPSDNLLDVMRSRRGDLWIGTFGGGLARLTLETGKIEKFDHWEGRLTDWSACGLVEDHAGMIWVSTSEGLSRIDPQKGGVRRFGLQDGLQSMAFHSRAARRLADGRLLLGSSRGFNLIDPRRLPAELPPPRPLLSGLELNGEPVKPAAEGSLLKKPLALTSELRIPFDPRMRFSLRYDTVYFADEGQVWFRFRMDPLDVQWQKGTLDRRATYQGLKPGDYQFVLQTSRDGRNWNGATSSIRVIILPPWFRTWWAILLGLALLLGLAVWVARSFHRRRQAAQTAERERLENDRNRAEAALARQLQHSMLVEQTVGDFRKGLNATAIFEGTLERLANYLRLSRCLIYWEPGAARQGQVLAEYVAHGIERLGPRVLWSGSRTLETVLHSETIISLHRRDTIGNEPLRQEWEQFWGADAVSVLAVRTVHEDRPNGILVLQVCGSDRSWDADERKLAESIASHLGLAIAQFGLSQREAEHRRELEEARLRADAANKAKGEFLAKMTHELRTPLNAIIGFAEVLETEGRVQPEQREGFDIITSSAEHLLGVINDVLEISKLEAGKTVVSQEEIDFPKMLRSVHGMLSVNAGRKGLRFELVPLSELPARIVTDKAKLRQILVNLLGNGIKFTETGGVSLRVLTQTIGNSAPNSNPPPGRRAVELVFEVLDTGPGIAPEELPGLFQTFVQTQTGRRAKEGTGLGLAIVKGFANQMGGDVNVVSRVGLGSLFTVRIPAWEILQPDQQQEPLRAAPTPDTPVPAGIRVLIVEDQPVNRLLLKKVLLRVGCVLDEAEDGSIAIKKWQSFQPDIILMDESMPVMGGTEATRQILTRAGQGPRPVIISLTAFAMAEQREAALAAGCTDFLAKPFKQQDLLGMLAKYAPASLQGRKAA